MDKTQYMVSHRFLIGGFDLEPEPIESIKRVLASYFAGYTYTIGEGGWHADGAPYAGGGLDPTKYITEPVHIFEVVCSNLFDLDEVKVQMSLVLSGHAEAIMVITTPVDTNNFKVSDHVW
jgi:hypothetical protein